MARILIVDDEPILLAQYAAALREKGHELVAALDGAEGLTKLGRNPDLIILDLMTPNVDGYDVIKHVRNTPGHETTPIIVVSGVATGEWATHLGANRFMHKPVRTEALLAAVAQLLGQAE